jgi:anti-sigma-K factor RskA
MAVLLVGQLGPAGGPAGPSGGQLASQARYVAMLQSPDGQDTGWVVEATAGGTVRLVPAGTPADIPAGRVWQFWTKAEGAAGPTSLGLVKARQTVELPVSALPELSERQLFEITLEPEGGSPIGRPTGPILYVGRSVRL